MSKRYKVVGSHTVLGAAPGTTFTADLSAADERYFVRAGHLEPVRPPARKPAKQKKGED